MTAPAARFQYEGDANLPRMAWCARMRQGLPDTRVLHGPWVEAKADFFCEGAWDGDFERGELETAVSLLGSGARLRGEEVLFATPSHILERLYSVRLREELLISNSLAFLLAQAGDDVDPAYKHYQHDLRSVMRGIGRGRAWIPTRGRRRVRLYEYANLVVGRDLALRALPKRRPAPYTSYDEYVARTKAMCASLHANATAASRAVQFTPLTTISSGYDSPACAVFAQHIGCTTAVTLTQARAAFDSEDDSGRAIGDILGLEVLEFARDAYLQMNDCPEAEFLASGTGGEEVVFGAFERVLPRTMLFTGYLGDSAWEARPIKLFTDLRMAYPGGLSLGEFRLRVGFIHLPLPVLGYINRPSLQAIAASPEMAPWSVASDYDRPIPRRLVEERGVPRHLFGQRKKAVTQPLVDLEWKDTVMATRSHDDFVSFARPTPEFAGLGQRLLFIVLGALHWVNVRVNWRIDTLARTLGTTIRTRYVISERYHRRPGIQSLMFHWGMHKVLPRYAARSTGATGGMPTHSGQRVAAS